MEEDFKVLGSSSGILRKQLSAAQLNRVLESYLMILKRDKLRKLIDIFIDKNAMMPYLKLLLDVMGEPAWNPKTSSILHDRDYSKFWIDYNPSEHIEFQDSIGTIFSDIRDRLIFKLEEIIEDEIWKEEQL